MKYNSIRRGQKWFSFWYLPGYYDIPLRPLAISSIAFLFENEARFSNENSKRVWNWDLLKNARLDIAKVWGRGIIPLSFALSLPRPRILAFSSLAFFLKPLHFRHVWGFHVKTSCFYFLIKRQSSRSRVVHRLGSEHHRLGWNSVGSLLWRRKISMHYLVFHDIHATLARNCNASHLILMFLVLMYYWPILC